jgi:L-ascorbate metabolism protein UlaG (beta-lactamase superfamily)
VENYVGWEGHLLSMLLSEIREYCLILGQNQKGINYSYDNQEFEYTDLILVSHDHFDHIGSAVPIVKLSKAQLGGPDETMKRLYKDEGLSPA